MTTITTLKNLIAATSVALAAILPLAASAQTAPQPARGADIVVAQAATADLTEGVIRKVDLDTKKLTIKHGDIKNLDMPGMTMVFPVKDPAMLATVKAGDKVKFRAERAGGGIVVTQIQVVK
jgi:Cu(I)/Ag(I) efflux system protein CusF